MVHENKFFLRRWEAALLFGVGFALLMGAWLTGQQKALAEQMVRLHVVANSDSAEDQAVKLRVRDAVLDRAEPWLEAASTQEEALDILIAAHRRCEEMYLSSQQEERSQAEKRAGE